MKPTFKQGDKVTADMSAYARQPPKRWDVVVVHPKSDELKDAVWVIRIIGLPGEKVSFSDGHILIDGKTVEPPPEIAAIHFQELGSSITLIVHPYTVPAESYYVMGDNPLAAFDSRMWGALPRANVLGKVLGK